MKNLDSQIATLILRAQNASNGGKGIYDLIYGCKRSHRDFYAGYGNKDTLIMEALRLICQGGSSFKFAVVDTGDYRTPTLIYFETRIQGEKYQVSFHSKRSYYRFKKHSFRMKWDHGCSQDSAMAIYRWYVGHGDYLGETPGGDVYD